MANREAAGNPGGGAEIVPVGQTRSSTQSIFGNIIDAISQIQQFAVIERTGQDIPDDFLTIRGKLNFFNMGFGNGFIEGILFTLLTALTLPIMSDEVLELWVERYFPLAHSRVFLWVLTCTPIIIAGGLCCFLSKYRIGMLSKSAVDSLLIGRLFSLAIKGILIFVLLIFLSKHLTPESTWKASYWISFRKKEVAENIYRVIQNVQPHLVATAYRTLLIFFIATVTPFFSIWLVSFYRKVRWRSAGMFRH